MKITSLGINDMNNQEPSFPRDHEPSFPRDHEADGHNGMTLRMTLRDYFAAKAMAAMIAQYPCQAIDEEAGGRLIDNDALTGDAYDIADAMLAAREWA